MIGVLTAFIKMGQVESDNGTECDDANVSKRQTRLRRQMRRSSMQIDGSLFNPRRRMLLRRSWRKTPKNGLQNVGVLLFLKLCDIDPSAVRLFGFHLVPKSELKYQKSFQKMAMRFTRAIDYIISNLNEQAKVTCYCRDLGKRHVRFLKRGFRPSHWNSFGEALTECAIDWEGGVRCRETLIGWRALVMFIIKEMRSAFMKELRERSQSGVSDSDDTDAIAMFRSLRREIEQYET